MSLIASLQFGDNQSEIYTKEYLVTDCTYSFMRRYNQYYPDADARCGTVEMTLVAPGKEDLGLFEWYIGEEVLSGRILFDLSNQVMNEPNPHKTLYFEDARCFSLGEDYHIDKARRRMLQLKFVADKMEVDSMSFIAKYL